MKVVAFIPIKFGSRRIPGKNTKRLYDGTPLMHLIQRTCLESKRIEETYIYCSNDSVKEYVIPGITYLKRPEYLDGDLIHAKELIGEFVKTIDADIYIMTHSTAPFAKAETIDECIEKVSSGKYDSAFCAENIKTCMWRDGRPINYDLDATFTGTQYLPDIYAETSIAYVFTKETFKKLGRRIGNKPFIKEVDKIEGMDIDWPDEFEIADAIYRKMKENSI